MNKKPKVSVCIITYNQKEYIGKCLQSVLDQRTDFEFEIIVGDDCSTDGTRDIVREFEAAYPGIIKPIYQDRNIGGGTYNFLAVHRAATGDYVAHVDGDDYCLPGKLQSQADMLDADPACNIVFHRMYLQFPSGALQEGPLKNVANLADIRFDRGALIEFMSIGYHSSKMYRRAAQSLSELDIEPIDYYVNVEQVGEGYARFAGRENLGVYRMVGGISATGSRSRIALANSIVHLARKYPQFRLEANTAALMCLVADARNGRATWTIYAKAWLRTFDIRAPWRLFKNLGFIKQLRAD